MIKSLWSLRKMSCFWDALIHRLSEYNRIPRPITPFELANFLKSKNRKTCGVLGQGEQLSKKQMVENFEHIQRFDPRSVNNGYDCSTCDPFLLLVSEVFQVNIQHNYMGHPVKYTRRCTCHTFPTLTFASSRYHFSVA